MAEHVIANDLGICFSCVFSSILILEAVLWEMGIDLGAQGLDVCLIAALVPVTNQL